MSHTPGPWTFKRDEEGDRRIYSADSEWSLFGDATYYPTVSDNEADWHLIAAAPDLLEALRYSVDNPEFDAERFDMLARAAIKKAEGK